MFNNEQLKLDELDDLAAKKEEERITKFEDKKRELQNEIDLANAEAGLERELIKAEQDAEKELEKLEAEFEKLQLNSLQKQELLALLTTQEEQIIQDIKDKFAEESLKKNLDVNKKVIAADKATAKARTDIANLVSGLLIGFLGKSLGARLAAIVIEGAIEAGLVGIQSASAQGKVSANIATANAKAIAASPLTFGQPFVGINTAQGVALNATTAIASKAAIAKIISATALKSIGTIASKAFYEGGQVPELGSGRITAPQNIPTQEGGDNVFAKVKRGEVILNKTQQERAGGDAFFRSIGVPSFATGGTFGIESTVGSPTTKSIGLDIELLGGVIAEQINDVKIVAIEQEITSAQISQVEIIEGARI